MNLPPAPPPATMPAAPSASASLDAAALARLRSLDPDGQRGVLARVLATFEASLSHTLAELAALPDPLDAAAVAAVAHRLKSSSASVGALQLAATCEDVERRARGDAGAARRHDLERLLVDGEAALAAVRAMLAA